MRRFARFVTMLAVLGLAAAACSGAKDTGFPKPGETPTKSESASPSPSPSAAESPEVDVADNEFEPKELTVKAGTTVVWSQTGSVPHTVTADDGSFDSHAECLADLAKCMKAGDTFEQAFDTPGRIAYYCKLHGGAGGAGMAGVIVVE